MHRRTFQLCTKSALAQRNSKNNDRILKGAANASLSNEGKSRALERFAREITSYVTSMTLNESEPDVGIVWATPLGTSLLEHDPSWQPGLTCPAPDESGAPSSLLDAATKLVGKTDLNISAQAATAQANNLATQNPKAKLADVANALILARCQRVSAQTGGNPAQKTAAMARYGEVVIEALQAKADAQPPAPAASAAAK